MCACVNVCVCVCAALVIQHAKCKCHITVACMDLPYFSTLSHNDDDGDNNNCGIKQYTQTEKIQQIDQI
jgi:hypothetical protein